MIELQDIIVILFAGIGLGIMIGAALRQYIIDKSLRTTAKDEP